MNYDGSYKMKSLDVDEDMMIEKYQKSLSFLKDGPIYMNDNISKRTDNEYNGVQETTFRMVSRDEKDDLPASEIIKELYSVSMDQGQGIYEQFLNQGSVLEFKNLHDDEDVFQYHCQIREERYEDGKILRILILSQRTVITKNERDEREMKEDITQITDYGVNALPYTSDRVASIVGEESKGSNRDRRQSDEQEDKFMDNPDIPEERNYTTVEETTENMPTRTYDGYSVTSRFQDSVALLPGLAGGYERNNIKLSTLKIDRAKEFEGQNTLSTTVRNKNLLGNPKELESSFRLQTIEKDTLPSFTDNKIERRKSYSPGLDKKETKFGEKMAGINIKTTGSDRPTKENAFVNTEPIKKFFKQHRTQLRKDNANTGKASSVGTATTTSSNRVLGMIENAFSDWKNIDRYWVWFVVVGGLCFASFAVLVSYFFIIKTEMDMIILDSKSLYHVGRRMENFLEVNRNVILMHLYVDGRITKDRHAFEGINDYVEYVHTNFTTALMDLQEENSMLRGYVYDLAASEQNQLYADYNTMNLGGSKVSEIRLNTFDAINQIVTLGMQIVKAPLDSLIEVEDQLELILDNSYGELLTNLQKPYDIYSIKIDKDYQIIDTFFIIVIVIIAVGFFIIFAYTYSELLDLFKDTIKFWESLLRFEVHTAEEHLMELRTLLSGFNRNHSFMELFVEVNNLKEGNTTSFSGLSSYKPIVTNKKIKDSGGFIKKSHDWRPLKTFLPTFIPMIVVFLLFIVTLSSSRVLVASESDKTDQFMADVKNLFQMSKLYTMTAIMTYKYIAFDQNMKINGIPLTTAITENLEAISQFYSMLQSLESASNSEARNFVEKDLCPQLPDLNQTLCVTAAHGANQKGLTGVVSYMTNSLNFMKSYYDSNKATSTAAKDTLDLLVAKELETEFLFLNRVFQELQDTLENKDQTDKENFTKAFFAVLIVIMLVELAIWLVLFRISYVNLRRHKQNQALVLRNIPLNLIWESKLLKNYIYVLFGSKVHKIK